jgi:hypothetical protein
VAADNHPLLLVQMKKGPVDRVVIGRSATKVLMLLASLVGLGILSGTTSGFAPNDLVRILAALLKP